MSTTATTDETHVSAQTEAAGFSAKKRTLALTVVSLAFVMDLLDSTIVNIAIPSIQSNLLASYSAIQWMVAGYALSFALLLVTGGRMGDVYGYKKIFMIGVGGFTVASLLSGLAWNPTALIFARLLQGSMAALMVPQVMSLMQVMYKPDERGKIMGLFGALGGLAASLGPIVGGLLIKANFFNLDWRPIFLINVPIGAFGLYAAAKYLPDGKSKHPLKLDLSGTAIVVVAMLLFIFPLIQGREYDWPAWALGMIAASLPVFALFAWWQKREEQEGRDPLIQPSLFRNRSFGVGLVINMVFEAAMLGFFLTFGLVQQIGLGFTPLHAAVTGVPLAVGIAFTMGAVGPKLAIKLGRYAISFGTVVMAIGLLLTNLTIHHYILQTHSWQLIPGLFVIGVGMGLVFGSLFAAVLNGVDPAHAGSASGTLNAIQQVGGAIGIAVVGIVFFGQLNHGAATSFNSIEPELRHTLTAQHIPAQAQQTIVASVEDCFVDRSKEKDSSIVPASCKQGKAADPAIQTTISRAATEANATNFAHAFHWSMIYAVSLLVGTFLLTFLLPRKFKPEAYAEAV